MRSSLTARCSRSPPRTALTSFLAPNCRKIRSPSPRPGRRVDRAAQIVGHRLHRALRPGAPFAEARARQAPRAEPLGELLQLVEIGARQPLGLRRRQPPPLDHAAGRVHRRLQEADAAAVVLLDQLGQVTERQLEAQVGLVRAVLPGRVGVGEALERARDLDAQHVLPELDHQPLDDVLHVVLGHEAHLEVDLGELRLAIEAQVLVAEAADDLEVAVDPRHHEELLEDLRRLGQRVELPRVEPRGHQEVARAARRVLHHEGRLDLQEPVVGQVAPRRLVDLRAGDEVLLQRRAPQIEVAVLEPDRLVRAGVVGELEGRRLGGRRRSSACRRPARCRRSAAWGSCGRRAREWSRRRRCRTRGAARRPGCARRRSVSGSKTIWVRPPRSRRSMKTQPP